jgi:hypothetical protein
MEFRGGGARRTGYNQPILSSTPLHHVDRNFFIFRLHVCRRRLCVEAHRIRKPAHAVPLPVCLIPVGLLEPSVAPQIAECQRVLEASGLEYKVSLKDGC